jgi:hypothetical protein
MSRFRALDRIDREKPDGVDRIALEAAGRRHVGCPLHDHQIVARAVRFGRHQASLPPQGPISAAALGDFVLNCPATGARPGPPIPRPAPEPGRSDRT